MSKVVVYEDKCIGCGACVAICEENFGFNEEGFSKVINEVPTDKTIEAKNACPTFAIDIVEENKECHHEKCTCESNCKCEHDDCECKKIEDTEEELPKAA